MKILFVAPEYHQKGGTEKSVYMLSHIFSRTDTIEIITSSCDPQISSNIHVIKVPRISRVQVLRFISFRISSDFVLWFRNLHRRDHYNIIHSTSADSGKANIITAHFCMKKYLRILENIETETLKGSTTDVPRDLLHRLFMNTVTYFEKRAFNSRRVRRIIAVSSVLKNDIVQAYGIDPEKITVIYNGVDLERFKPMSSRNFRETILTQMGIPVSSTIILFAGGEWKRKGLEYLLQANTLLNKKDVHVLIIGEGDQHYFRSRFIKDREGSERIHFLSFDEKIEQWYNLADIFVLPSLYEPFGMVGLEAMACGTPVITTNYAGLRDLIQNEVSGCILEDPRDLRVFAEKLGDLAENPEKRENMGKAAREQALRCSWDRIARQTKSVYEEIL